MVISAVFAFLHFTAVFGIFGTIFVEWQTMSRQPTYAEHSGLRQTLWILS
jgi:putative membrane protein